jgi:hypothetical protein
VTQYVICSAGVSVGLSRKDELFNDLLDECVSHDIDFPDSSADFDENMSCRYSSIVFYTSILPLVLW